MQEIAIVIPCYNEENRFQGQSILQFSAQNPFIHFILVNDGSTDNTAHIIAQLQQRNPEQISTINFQKNYGKAEAVRQGFIQAFKNDFAYIGFWDADFATPLYEINNLQKELIQLGRSICIASRVKLLNRNIKRKLSRHYLGRVFATATSIILQLAVYDTQCGAKLFKNNDELKAVFAKPFSVTWVFDVEIIARYILVKEYRQAIPFEEDCIEYPLQEWSDVPGSKLRLTDFFKALFELAKIGFILHAPGREKRAGNLLVAN